MIALLWFVIGVFATACFYTFEPKLAIIPSTWLREQWEKWKARK